VKIFEVCEQRLKERSLNNDKRYLKRYKWEKEEIIVKGKESYFQDLFDKKIKYSKNQNNLLICWLLDIVADFSIDKDPICTYGEFPDIDSDYIASIRNYLKEEWAPKFFGEEYVCNIGNYTTFGIKNSLIDMVRVHGGSRDEILVLTKNIEPKDDDGKAMTWDAAMKLYPELKKYCEENPEVAEASKKLLHRNRGMGVHAGGLIISSTPLADLVPLVKKKDAVQASAWVEGLNGQDLQPVGLVKFDLLVVSCLLQIARCCELVKKRHNLKSICALENQEDWSDVDVWRNDPIALGMANLGDLKGIFQFDSDTVRNMCIAGGVDRFEDLVAYTSLNRPAALNMKMQERYIERKRGRETYSLHPLLQPILGDTYGVMVYQEQVMKILNVVGEIPLKDCELVRKAISKKKIESFIKYKEMFLVNGQKNLGVDEKEINQLWSLVESFSEYGFNLSHAVSYTYISSYLLYLKAHYPQEFYTSVLSCENSSDKIKEYKMEAKLHNVNVMRLDINKSKVDFDLQDKDIYFGISDIKGIGEAPASRIVELQPYNNFEDFLERFGTDASVLKPLIGLGCFKDRDPIVLWKFSDAYKTYHKKTEDKKKRFIISMEKYEEEFKELFPEENIRLADMQEEDPYESSYWKKYDIDDSNYVERREECDKEDEGAQAKVTNGVVTLDCGVTIEKEIVKYYRKVKVKKGWNRLNAFKNLCKKRKRSIEKYNRIKEDRPRLSSFDPSEYEIDSELEADFNDPIACENKYYGFAWIHPLESSPDYRGNFTFNNLKNSTNIAVGIVEMRVIKVNQIKSKKGTTYYQMIADDVTGQINKINIWQDDWDRWEKELSQGNLLRVRLQPPSNGFPTFTMESNQIRTKWKSQKKYSDKKEDFRVIVLEKGKLQKPISNEECLTQFDECTMEIK